MTHNSETLRKAFGYLFPAELPLLKSLPGMIDHSPCVVVNVGAGAGTSGLAFLESRPDLELHTVDITDLSSPFGCLEAERQVGQAAGFKLGDRWRQYHMDSKALAEQWTGGPVDIVFIDGDHTYEGCVGDIVGWMQHIRPGGLMAVHDCYKAAIPTGPDGYHADGPHPQPYPMIDQAVDELLVGKYEMVAYVDSLIVFRIQKD